MSKTTTFQAFFGDKLVGTRKSPRLYTHALVLTAYQPEIDRASLLRQFSESQTRDNISYMRRIVAAGVGGVTGGRFSHAVRQADFDDAAARLGNMSDDELVAKARAAHAQRVEESVARSTASGDVVLSWHQSATNTAKALAAAQRKGYLACYRLIAVEAVAKAPHKSAAEKIADGVTVSDAEVDQAIAAKVAA